MWRRTTSQVRQCSFSFEYELWVCCEVVQGYRLHGMQEGGSVGCARLLQAAWRAGEGLCRDEIVRF